MCLMWGKWKHKPSGNKTQECNPHALSLIPGISLCYFPSLFMLGPSQQLA